VAKSAQGKWVSRVGASGGGKSYKKTRPLNYYGALAIIVVLGLTTVLYSRYEYQNPNSSSAVTTTTLSGPLLGATSYIGLATEACGEVFGALPETSTTSAAGYHVLANNVVRLKPTNAAEAGVNATIAQLVTEIPGLTFSTKKFVMPTASGQADTAHTYVTGDKCPAGTKYAGKVGRVVVAYWTSGTTVPVKLSTNPFAVPLSSNLLATLAFEPANVAPQAPSSATVQALLKAEATAVTTTTAATTTTLAVTTTTPATTTTTSKNG
jgi:hypothetical protein